MWRLILPLFFLSSSTAFALSDQSPYFFSVTAKPGDGITILLSRYQLDAYECNIEKFLEMNQLSLKDQLLQGKEYKLPVMIYQYNGKSIRSTLGINDMEAAQRIANYNQLILNKKLRKSDYVSSKILWVPYHELNCPKTSDNVNVASEKPITKTNSNLKTETVSIFGRGYEKLTVKSNKLKGKVYYISSGHGGPDPGAVAKMGNRTICEDEYAYDVSLRLARNLMENGATVHIVVQDDNDGIRNDDILVCDHDEKTMGDEVMPINQLARLKQRTDAINKLYGQHARAGVKEQVLVCIHVDSRSENYRQDVFFYHFEHSKSGKKLAHNVMETFEQKYAKYRAGNDYQGSVSTRNLYMIRVPYPTTLYVELANIKNEADRKRILPATNRQALANWLYEGLVK